MAQMGDALAPLSLGGDERVLDLSAGYRHACAVLETTGAVKCWGANGEGQLGVGDVQSRGLSPEDMGDNLEVVDLGTIR
jgi:alpha-tubulin suppressor-like RCC1 family protein